MAKSSPGVFKINFGGNRELAIQRDKEKCVACGLTRKEHQLQYGRDITVDHIDGLGRNTAKVSQNHSLNNLKTLCLRCHGRKDNARRSNRAKVLNAQQVKQIKNLREQGMYYRDIAQRFKVSVYCIYSISTGKTWKEIK